jgi:hypothetical protein
MHAYTMTGDISAFASLAERFGVQQRRAKLADANKPKTPPRV